LEGLEDIAGVYQIAHPGFVWVQKKININNNLQVFSRFFTVVAGLPWINKKPGFAGLFTLAQTLRAGFASKLLADGVLVSAVFHVGGVTTRQRSEGRVRCRLRTGGANHPGLHQPIGIG
jgi:hypothetical protein